MRGKFIVVDGMDGCGKTTLINNLCKIRKLYRTFEPGGTEFGKNIRELVCKNHNSLSPVSEALLMFADREEHLKLVQEKIKQGYDVICDRYVGSSYIYQGDIGFKKIKELEQNLLTNFIKPDYEFIMYTSYEEYLRRKGQADEVNDLDPSNEKNFNHLLENMNLYIQSHPDVIPLDVTNLDENELVDKILDFVDLS